MAVALGVEQAAGGSRSLKFVDGPGQEHPYNPHVFYRTGHEFGRLVGRLDLRVDAATSFYYQWRDYTGAFVRGPTVQIMPGGSLVHDGRELMMVPPDEWVSYEVECGLGDDGDGSFELRVSLPGAARYAKLQIDRFSKHAQDARARRSKK